MANNIVQFIIDGEHIFIGGLSSVGHCLCQLVGAPIDGQWLPIPHPDDSGGRRTSGDTGQCLHWRVKYQVGNIGPNWRICQGTDRSYR